MRERERERENENDIEENGKEKNIQIYTTKIASIPIYREWRGLNSWYNGYGTGLRNCR